jgi:hypothetical protein
MKTKKETTTEEKVGKKYTPERMVRFVSHLIRKPVYSGFYVLPEHMSNKR